MDEKRLRVLLAAGPEITRDDRKRLRDFWPVVKPLAVAVHLACRSMYKARA